MSELTEKSWQDQVVKLASLYGWAHFHVYNSRRSNPGWPDLVLARPPQLIAVELKTNTGRLRPDQRDWLARLEACGIETHVWRPRDLDEVLARLAAR